MTSCNIEHLYRSNEAIAPTGSWQEILGRMHNVKDGYVTAVKKVEIYCTKHKDFNKSKKHLK